ncbi:hypothetical protein O3S80_15350 [Streptomyces sp. Lzd4kr]|nr:hypothetical protein [Streptomyces sp. Lzd4kr]
MDENLVLEALVHQGLLQRHSAPLGRLVEQGAVPVALLWAEAVSVTTPMFSPTKPRPGPVNYATRSTT